MEITHKSKCSNAMNRMADINISNKIIRKPCTTDVIVALSCDSPGFTTLTLLPSPPPIVVDDCPSSSVEALAADPVVDATVDADTADPDNCSDTTESLDAVAVESLFGAAVDLSGLSIAAAISKKAQRRSPECKCVF